MAPIMTAEIALLFVEKRLPSSMSMVHGTHKTVSFFACSLENPKHVCRMNQPIGKGLTSRQAHYTVVLSPQLESVPGPGSSLLV